MREIYLNIILYQHMYHVFKKCKNCLKQAFLALLYKFVINKKMNTGEYGTYNLTTQFRMLRDQYGVHRQIGRYNRSSNDHLIILTGIMRKDVSGGEHVADSD